MTISVGYSLVSKQGGMSVGTQMPIPASPVVETSYTQEPIDVVERRADRKVLTHRHFGHPEEHPVTLRHRKASIDPLHGEEDKIIDEYKDLYDKARRGECNSLEMRRIQEIRGRLQEIQASRETDARRILGRDMVEAADAQGGSFSLKPRPQQPPAVPKPNRGDLLTQTASMRSGKTFKGEIIHKALEGSMDTEDTFYGDDVAEENGIEKRTISWSVDAAIMATNTIMKSMGEPDYPADDPEDYGINGSMADPTIGEVASDSQHPASVGPYAGSVTIGSISRKARPKGWTKGSSEDFWESVSEKGPHSRCVEHVGGTVDDPHAFCAWAEHEGTGHWPGERRGKNTEEKAAGDYYLGPGEQPPPGANVQQGPRGGRFIPGGGSDGGRQGQPVQGGGRLHPRDVQELEGLKVQGQAGGPETGAQTPAEPAIPDEDEMRAQWAEHVGRDFHASPEEVFGLDEVEDRFSAFKQEMGWDGADWDEDAIWEQLNETLEANPDLVAHYIDGWASDDRSGDLREGDYEELAADLVVEFSRAYPAADRDAVVRMADEAAKEVFDDLSRKHGWLDYHDDDDHPSLSPGERNPSMGRWSSDPVVVPSSANVYKGAAFVQRPAK